MRFSILFLLFFMVLGANAQSTVPMDTLKKTAPKAVSKKTPKHTLAKMFYSMPVPQNEIPRIAFLRTVVPGWGQYTNKQYWKVPIVAGAAIGGVITIVYNKKQYENIKPTIAYLNEKGLSSTTQLTKTGTGDVLYRYKDVNYYAGEKTYQSSQLTSYAYQLRSNYNLSIIGVGVGWLLVAIEANVAAHLKSFDVSNNISMQIKPKIGTFGSKSAGLGIQLNFK